MYCSSESFDVSCGHNEVILMKTAYYGRMHEGRCVSAQYANSLGCYVDVLQYMDNQCSGKQKCKMLVATLEGVSQPCKKDFKSYLEAKHTCVPGELITNFEKYTIYYITYDFKTAEVCEQI